MRVDIFCWALILTWLVGSIYCGVIGETDLFQRLGSLGVAVAVLYFALQKHGVRVPPGFREANELTQKQIEFSNRVADATIAKTTLLAKALVHQAEQTGTVAYPKVIPLSRVAFDEALLRAPFEDFETKRNDVTKAQIDADKLVARNLRTSEMFQAIVVILGTIQWGFGDLLVCWMNDLECASC